MTYAETVQQFQKDLQEIANQIENDFKKNRFITYSLEYPRSPLIDRINDLRWKYKDSDIWECIKEYLPRITEKVYKSREEKKHKDELEKKYKKQN